MGYSLIYTPVLHFDDINGRPLVGGKLYTYKAGTSTPAPTYRNSAGTELNENPISLNERGECVCFLRDGSKYKFVLKDALDNTIWEQDNVSIPAGEGGGGGGGSQVQADWAQNDSSAVDFIKNKPDMEEYAKLADLAAVAFSGDYDDLSNRPTLATVARTGNYNDLVGRPNLASVALTGDYEDLRNLPDIPSLSLFYHSQQVSINAGVASSPERYNLNVFVPAGKRFVGTLTISAMHTSQGSGAYHYTLYVPGASMRCIFGTYPAIPQSGHTIGMSVDNPGDTPFRLYFELSGTFESQNVDIYINGIVF